MENWSQKRVRRPRGETVVRRHARRTSQQQHQGQRPRQGPSGSGRQACSPAARNQARKEVLKVDVKDAHRLIPISLEDWHLLACRSERDKYVHVNTTGTFGAASAACWWSRVATAAIRGAHFVLGHELPAWLVLVTDDLALQFHNGKNVRISAPGSKLACAVA